MPIAVPHSALRNLYPLLLDGDGELIADLKQIKLIAKVFIKDNIENSSDLKTMLRNIDNINDVIKMYDYFSNSLLCYENKAYFYRISGDKLLRFRNICTDGRSVWDQ